jgi:hypothetical protein
VLAAALDHRPLWEEKSEYHIAPAGRHRRPHATYLGIFAHKGARC